MTRSISLHDVARRAGVSHTAVSLVLNRRTGRKRVSDKKAARIRRIVHEMGYVPNHAARSLRLGKTRAIVLATPTNLRYAYVHELIEEIQTQVTLHDYHLNLELLRRPQDRESTYRTFVPGRCDGIIIVAACREFPEQLAALRKSGMPLVAIDMSRRRDLDCVYHDVGEAVRIGTAHLIQRGHQRIVFVLDHQAGACRNVRIRGYRRALKEARMIMDDTLLLPWKVGDDPAELWRRIAALRPKPSAILCYNTELTAALLREVRRARVCVPEDMALVALGDAPLNMWVEVPLTAVDSNHPAVARVAVERLLTQIGEPSTPPRQIRVQPILVVRESSGKQGLRRRE